jgi:predicted permease
MFNQWISTLRLRLRTIARRRQLDQDLEDEMRFHLEMREEKLRGTGLDRGEAFREARLRFGNPANIKEATREMWTFSLLESIWGDLRYGVRVLRRNPLFTAAAVLSLALGIGANTAIFTLVKAVFLEKLPVAYPDQLVIATWSSQRSFRHNAFNSIGGTDPKTGRSYTNVFQYPSYEQFRKQAKQLSEVFAFTKLSRGAFRTHGRTTVIEGMLVSGNYYRALGVQPLLGRLLNDADDQPGAEPVAVISYQLWRDAFGSDGKAVGSAATLNGVAVTIAGVTQPSFYGVSAGGFMPSPDVTVSLRLAPAMLPWLARVDTPLFLDGGYWWLNVMGRLRAGAAATAAEAELNAIFRQALAKSLARELLDERGPRLALQSGAQGLDSVRESAAEPLWTLFVAAGLMLLIACANVATLLLARAAARQNEITARLALGASRGRLIRQLLTESLLVSFIAGVVGVLLSWWGSRVLLGWAVESEGPVRLPVGLDFLSLAFTAGVSMITGILFGLAPAFRASRIKLVPALKSGAGAGWEASRAAHPARLSQGLVAVQVALSLVLIVGAGLFVRTLWNLRNVDLGFRSQGLLLFGIDPSLQGYDGARSSSLHREILTRLESTPGVLSASASSHRLITGWVSNGQARIPGAPGLQRGRISVHFNNVGPRYFETMGIPVVLGRGAEARDTANGPRVVFINQSLADKAFEKRSPLGATVFLSGRTSGRDVAYEIAGVVANAHYDRVRRAPPPTIYVPYEQTPDGAILSLHFAVRTAGPPQAFAGTARALMREVDPNLPLIDVKTQERIIDEQLVRERVFANLSTAFGALALLLACVGIYGMVAYAVTRRTGEFGIRMALGAGERSIMWLVLRRMLPLLALGVAGGIAAAFAGTRLIASMLYQVAAADPGTFLGGAALLIVVALVAAFLPARRAARIEPMAALRCE